MYGMNNSENIFFDELTNWMIYEGGLKHPQCQMSIYYKYALYGSKLVVLSYDDECVN